MLTSAAMRAGFSGGLVVDFPHSTRAKKYFLVLMVGHTSVVPTGKGLNGKDDVDADEVSVAARRSNPKKQKTGSMGTVSYFTRVSTLPLMQDCWLWILKVCSAKLLELP